MNYYPHHIGDFNNATRHLNRVERSIYRDLIELYYDKESPFKYDIEQICKKVLANTEEECVAVQSVLSEFFTLEDGFYHHYRCDDEIAKYQAKADSARANGKKGGRPKNPEKTQSVILANPEETGSKANQEPITNNQEPIKKKGAKRFTPPSLDEVKAYILEKQYDIDGEYFINFYESKGWMIGKNKMKDWKATIRGWNTRNEKNRQTSAPKAKQYSDKLDEIAARDIAENGFANTLDN